MFSYDYYYDHSTSRFLRNGWMDGWMDERFGGVAACFLHNQFLEGVRGIKKKTLSHSFTSYMIYIRLCIVYGITFVLPNDLYLKYTVSKS